MTIWSVDMNINADKPELFDKDNKMDRLALSNQIGYHFKKVVREVSQELFVSRKVDVSALFQGITTLKQTQQGLYNYCQGITSAVIDVTTDMKKSAKFIYVREPEYASFHEVKARCEALNMQLPELYTNIQIGYLNTFLRDHSIKKVFAGIIPEPVDAIHRFISTGFPIWRTPHTHLIDIHNNEVNMMLILDDLNAKFLYTAEGQLLVYWENPNIQWNSTFGDSKYREKIKELSQALAPVVCEPKWDGKTYGHFKSQVSHLPELVIKPRFLRSVKPKNSSVNPDDWIGIKSLKELCISIADQAGEISQDMSVKLINLLSLVDISVHLEQTNEQDRRIRSLFLSKFIFTTGVRLIWNLYGFVQMMRMNKRIGRVESNLSTTQSQVNLNSKTISNMSLLIYSQSIAINQLKVTTADLDRRLSTVESKVEFMEHSLADIINKLEASTSLSLVASLIQRIQQSLNTGYDTLKDIIHCSLLGQTSPLLLPIDQIQLVQNEVRKVSTGVLDTDFARMQSIVVSDPLDPHLLLVVINVAALGRRNVELIKLVPIPYYENDKALSPVLDYNTVILDQYFKTYSILTEQEEYDCLFNRCYISDVERSINDKTCGIPQMFSQHLDVCISEETLSTGVFIKPMLPDGILFAFKDEVTTQLFCKDNNVIGPIKKLNGTGIMQLPNGCTLTVTDNLGRSTKVKGQPLYRMIDADDLTLSINGPLSALQAVNSRNFTHKMTPYDQAINDHLTSVVKQVKTVDLQLTNQRLSIWILISAVIALVIITTVVVIIAYKHREKFYTKIHELRERFTEIHQAISDFRRTIRGSPPPTSPRPDFDQLMTKNRGNIYRHHKTNVPRSNLTDLYISMTELSPEKDETDSLAGFRPIDPLMQKSGLSRKYPRLTPLLSELNKPELKVNDEVQQLCKTRLHQST